MTHIEIGTVGQWFSGVVALIVLLYTIFRERIDLPTLELSFMPSRDIKSQQNTVNPVHPGLSRWLRVKVVNSHSRKVVKNCRAYLVGITRILPDGSKADVFPNDCRQLLWMHDNPDSAGGRDLLPGIGYWADVAATFDNPTTPLTIRTTPNWGIDTAGEYLVTLQVSAEGVEHTPTLRIYIVWLGPGKWESLSGRHGGSADSY